MEYLDNVSLSILIYLLIKKELRFKLFDQESLEQLYMYLGCLEWEINPKPRYATIEEEEEAELHRINILDIKKENFHLTITLTCKDQTRLKQILDKYIENYENGDLVEEENTFKTFKVLKSNFEDMIKGLETNPKRFNCKIIDFAPLFLKYSHIDPKFIVDLDIKLAYPESMSDPIKLFEYSSDENENYLRENRQDYFECHYVLNVTEYLKRLEKKHIRENIKYSKQQENILHFIKEYSKEMELNYIDVIDLSKGLKLRNDRLNMAISRLNKKYMKINNTDKKLIQYNRGKSCYDFDKEYIDKYK